MIPLFYSFQIGNPIVRGLQPYHKIGCNSVTPITTVDFDDFGSGMLIDTCPCVDKRYGITWNTTLLFSVPLGVVTVT